MAYVEFDAILAQSPDHPQALYGRAQLLAEKGRDAEAIRHLDRAIAARPGLLEARRCRAVLQARQGNLDAAREEISACLAKAPDSGAVLYAAACVAAWEARRSPANTAGGAARARARARALALLEKAFARGFGWATAAHDPDLVGVQGDAAFQRLLDRTKTPANGSRNKP